jgi:hypothetical protein
MRPALYLLSYSIWGHAQELNLDRPLRNSPYADPPDVFEFTAGRGMLSQMYGSATTCTSALYR